MSKERYERIDVEASFAVDGEPEVDYSLAVGHYGPDDRCPRCGGRLLSVAPATVGCDTCPFTAPSLPAVEAGQHAVTIPDAQMSRRDKRAFRRLCEWYHEDSWQTLDYRRYNSRDAYYVYEANMQCNLCGRTWLYVDATPEVR
jgi:hypothetical protein